MRHKRLTAWIAAALVYGIGFMNSSAGTAFAAETLSGAAVVEGVDTVTENGTSDTGAAQNSPAQMVLAAQGAVQNDAVQSAAAGTVTAGNSASAAAQNSTVQNNAAQSGSSPAASAAAGSGAASAGSTSSGPAFNAGSLASAAAGTVSSGTDHAVITLPGGYYFDNVGMYTYDMMVQDLSRLQSQYPSMQLDSLATTCDGRNLYHVLIGNPAAAHKIFVHAGIHAREYIACQLAMRELGSLLEAQKNGVSYGGQSIAALLQKTSIQFVPMVNPDGISLCQFGAAGLLTQAARDNFARIAALDNAVDLNSYVKTFKSNLEGVNLNKNFDANWAMTGDSKGHPSAVEYKGTAAECEAESKALADLTRKYKFDRTISYHTQGRVIYWNFGQSEPCRTQSMQLAQIVKNNSGYMISDYYAPNDAAGYKDWAVSRMNIPSVTIECGTGTSPVDEGQISSIWEQNKGILPDVLLSLSAS